MGEPWKKYKPQSTTKQAPENKKPWESYGGVTDEEKIVRATTVSSEPVYPGPQPPASLQNPQVQPAIQTSPYQPTVEQVKQQAFTVPEKQEVAVNPMEQGREYVSQQKPQAFIVEQNGEMSFEKPISEPKEVGPQVKPVRPATMEEVVASPEKQKELYARGKELQSTDIKGSTDVLLQAFEGNPTDPNTSAQLAYNYAQLGDVPKVLEFANVSIANESAIPAAPGTISKGNYGAYQLKSWAETQLGNPEEGLKSAEEAIRLQQTKTEPEEYFKKDQNDYYNLSTSYSYAANAAAKLGDQNAVNKYVELQKQSINKAGKIEAAKSQESYLKFVADGGLESYDVLKEILYPLKYGQAALEAGYETVKGATKLMNKGAGEQVDFDAYIKPVNSAMNTAFSVAMVANPISAGVFQALEVMTGGIQETTGLPTAIALEKAMKPFTFISKDVLGREYADKNQALSETLDIIGMTVMFMGIHNSVKGVKAIAGKIGKQPTLGEIAKGQETGNLAGKIIGRKELTDKEAKQVETIISEATPDQIKQVVELNNKIKSAQEKGVAPKEVETFVAPETKRVLSDIEAKKDILNADLDKASEQLYEEYERLKSTKEAETRRNTTEQVDAKMEELWSQRERINEVRDIQKREGKFVSQIEKPKVAELPEGQKPITKTETAEPGKASVQEGVDMAEDQVAPETSPHQSIIKELDEIATSETPNEVRRMELIKELQEKPEVKEGVFSDVDASIELRGKEFKAEQKRLREKHGDQYDKARSITNNFDDIVNSLQKKYETFKKICP